MSTKQGVLFFHCTDDKIVHVRDESVFKSVDVIQKAREEKGHFSSGVFHVPVESQLFIMCIQFLKQHKDEDPNQPGEFDLTDWDRKFFIKNFTWLMKLINASVCLEMMLLYKGCQQWVTEQHNMAKSSSSSKNVTKTDFKIDKDWIDVFDANEDVLEKINLLLSANQTVSAEVVAQMSGSGKSESGSQTSASVLGDKYSATSPFEDPMPSTSTGIEIGKLCCETDEAGAKVESHNEVGKKVFGSNDDKETAPISGNYLRDLCLNVKLLVEESVASYGDVDDDDDVSYEAKAKLVAEMMGLLSENVKQNYEEHQSLQKKYDECVLERDELKQRVEGYDQVRNQLSLREAEIDRLKRVMAHESIEALPYRLYECKICGFYVSTQEFLVQHLKSAHEL